MRLSDEEFMDLAAISIMNGLVAGRHGHADEDSIKQYLLLAHQAALGLTGLRHRAYDLLQQQNAKERESRD